MTSTLTSKGQITLPGKIRKKLNLNTGDKIDFVLDDSGRIYLAPVKTSVKKLKGILPKPDYVVSLEEMQAAIEGGENNEGP